MDRNFGPSEYNKFSTEVSVKWWSHVNTKMCSCLRCAAVGIFFLVCYTAVLFPLWCGQVLMCFAVNTFFFLLFMCSLTDVFSCLCVIIIMCSLCVGLLMCFHVYVFYCWSVHLLMYSLDVDFDADVNRITNTYGSRCYLPWGTECLFSSREKIRLFLLP